MAKDTRVLLPLPAWAKHQELKKVIPGNIPVVIVDADAMYVAWLTELMVLYANPDNHPREWYEDKDPGELKSEWVECLSNLSPDDTTAYWAESAYQCGKMELQVAQRTFQFENRIKDEDKRFRLEDLPQGRGVDMASGGPTGGREARGHFQRARGVMPA